MIIMKTLLTFSDPYVRIDLNTINGDINIDSVLTKTKKKVIISNLQMGNCGRLYGAYLISCCGIVNVHLNDFTGDFCSPAYSANICENADND